MQSAKFAVIHHGESYICFFYVLCNEKIQFGYILKVLRRAEVQERNCPRTQLRTDVGHVFMYLYYLALQGIREVRKLGLSSIGFQY